jgi:hypothetical protein
VTIPDVLECVLSEIQRGGHYQQEKYHERRYTRAETNIHAELN